MKTPEQWIKEYNNDREDFYYRNAKERKLSFRSGDLIRAIQQDARQSAFREAIELIKTGPNQTHGETICKMEMADALQTLSQKESR